MSLSSELISQFVKITNDKKDTTNKETTTYGKIVKYEGRDYVQLDGSDLLTPVNTTTDTADGDRVTVSIKNHSATVTGNLSSPSARTDDVKEIGSKITELEVIMAYKVTTENLEAITATIESLRAVAAKIDNADILNAEIDNLESKYIESEYITAEDMKVLYADIERLEATFGEFTDISAEDMEVVNAEITNLKTYNAEFTYVSAEVLTAMKADIKTLNAEKLSAKDADLKYANIDFTNIGEAAIEHFYATSGLIKDVTVGDGTITGELVGVTIKGDLIEGGTVIADKLVIKGEDGLYYKLNTDGETIETEQTEYNSLDGKHILAKSITATKISVQDLVAFGATIGGFHITDNSIYSGVKESADNTTRGIYLDNEGQMVVGDSNNFVKFFKDENGEYKLEISASSLKFGISQKNVEEVIDEVTETTQNTVKDIRVEYALSDSPTEGPTEGWSTTAPEWTEGKYMWQKTTKILVNGMESSSEMTCISGAKGSDAVLLQILSSNGHMFKNSSTSTTLTVEILVGNLRLTSSSELYLHFGGNAKIIWQQKKFGETEFTDISEDDPRISDNGFIFTINAEDLKLQTVYTCVLDC